MGDGDAAATLDQAEIGRIFREESGRSVATLIGVFGDIDLAEDAVQEAFAVALHRWPADGPPPNPGGWITTTARNRAIDRLRRESRGRELLGEVAALSPGDQEAHVPDKTGAVPDDRLRLLTDGVGSHQHGRDGLGVEPALPRSSSRATGDPECAARGWLRSPHSRRWCGRRGSGRRGSRAPARLPPAASGHW